jgi:hypothetical protein
MPLILLQADPVLAAVLPTHTTIGVNSSGRLYVKQPDATVQVIASSTPSYESLTNASGSSIVTPVQPQHVAKLTISGTARTVPVIIAADTLIPGASVKLLVILPAISGVIVDVRNATGGGIQLDTFTSDGEITAVQWELYANASQWNIFTSKAPAY